MVDVRLLRAVAGKYYKRRGASGWCLLSVDDLVGDSYLELACSGSPDKKDVTRAVDRVLKRYGRNWRCAK